MEKGAILPHNLKPASVWNAGGEGYDEVSRTIADAIEHCVTRLVPKPGERVLDVATGTGWTSRAMATRGCKVMGIDLGDDLIKAATARARASHLSAEYMVGDAEKLPFEDASFDVVVSTFGVMFATNPEAAAQELARVCKKGGRLGLTTWPVEGTIADLFKVMKPYMASPPPATARSPFEWGKDARVKELLGQAFSLRFETGTTYLRAPSGAAVWEIFVKGYGPTKSIAAGLTTDRIETLKRDFIAFHEKFKCDLGISMPREYLVTIGVRK